MNEGPEWGPQQWAKIVGVPASSVYTVASAKTSGILAEDRKRKSTVKEKSGGKIARGQITLFNLGLTIQNMTIAQHYF